MLFVTSFLQIPDDEIEFTFVRSSGPGGQAVNKVSSKARLRWNPHASASLRWDIRARFLERFGNKLTETGDLLLASDRHRDRLQNRDDCLDKLKEMLLEVAYPPKVRKATKPTFGSKRRNEKAKREQKEKKKNRNFSGGLGRLN